MGVLTNAGTVNWEAGDVDVIYYPYDGYTGEIWNQTNGVWDMACDQTLNNNYDLATFHNAGNLLKSADGGTTSFNLYLNNSGVVEGQNGTIEFNGGSDMGGTFQADANAAIYFEGGNYTLGSAPNFQGMGMVEFMGGNFALNNFTGVLDIFGGAVSGSVAGTLNMYGGQLDPGASLTVASNGVLNIEGSIQIVGVLTNAGTINWEAGDVDVIYYPYDGYTGEIWNQTNGVWDMACDQTLNNNYDLATFHNAGNLLKSADGGTTSFNVYLNNSGVVEGQNGTIEFNGGSDMGGTFQADTDAAIYFEGGNYTLGSAPNFQGMGMVEFTGGNFALNNFTGVLDIFGGAVSGSVAGTLNMYGGQLDPGAELTVLSNAVMNIEGSIQIVGVLTNAGTINWEAGDVDVIYYPYYGYTGEIWNQTNGVWDMACDQTLYNNYDLATFHNAGKLLKSAGGGTTSFNVYLNNSGVVEGQNGTIEFNGGSDMGGTFQADTDAAIYFEGGNYTLGSAPNFQGAGTVKLANANVVLNNCTGTLDVSDGELSGTLAGTLNISGGHGWRSDSIAQRSDEY